MNPDEFASEYQIQETLNSCKEFESAYLEGIYDEAGAMNESELDWEQMARMEQNSTNRTNRSSFEMSDWIHHMH